MSNTFDLRRFGLLLKKQFIDSWKWLLLSYGLISVVVAIILIVAANSICQFSFDQATFDHTMRESLLAASLVLAYLFSALAAGGAFKTMRYRATRLPYLMLPASQAEKYCAAVIFAVPVFIVGYVAAMYLGQCIAAVTFPAFNWDSDFHISVTNWIGDALSETDGPTLRWILLTLLANQSFFFLGGIVWGKAPFFKTTGVIAGMTFICSQLALATAYAIFANGNNILNLNYFADHTYLTILSAIFWIIIIFNYSVAYLRQRELEVINRW